MLLQEFLRQVSCFCICFKCDLIYLPFQDVRMYFESHLNLYIFQIEILGCCRVKEQRNEVTQNGLFRWICHTFGSKFNNEKWSDLKFFGVIEKLFKSTFFFNWLITKNHFWSKDMSKRVNGGIDSFHYDCVDFLLLLDGL